MIVVATDTKVSSYSLSFWNTEIPDPTGINVEHEWQKHGSHPSLAKVGPGVLQLRVITRGFYTNRCLWPYTTFIPREKTIFESVCTTYIETWLSIT